MSDRRTTGIHVFAGVARPAPFLVPFRWDDHSRDGQWQFITPTNVYLEDLWLVQTTIDVVEDLSPDKEIDLYPHVVRCGGSLYVIAGLATLYIAYAQQSFAQEALVHSVPAMRMRISFPVRIIDLNHNPCLAGD